MSTYLSAGIYISAPLPKHNLMKQGLLPPTLLTRRRLEDTVYSPPNSPQTWRPRVYINQITHLPRN